MGRALIRELLLSGWAVTALLLPHEANSFPFRSDATVECVTGDLDTFSPDAIPRGSVVFHLAAIVHEVINTEEQVAMLFHVNRDGTVRLARSAVQREARGFLFLSTIAIYGRRLIGNTCREDDPADPETPYAASKWQAEQALPKALSGKVPWIIFRPAVMYGPEDHGNFRRIIDAVGRGFVPILDSGRARKNALFVGNMAAILRWFGEHTYEYAGSVYNVADPQILTIREIAATVSRILRVKLRVFCIPSFMVRLAVWLGDILTAATGWRMPIDSDRLQALTRDNLVDVRRLQSALSGAVRILSFEEGLRTFLRSRDGQDPGGTYTRADPTPLGRKIQRF